MAKRFDSSVVAKFRAMEKAFTAAESSSGKSRLDRLDLPARSLLRLRCVFGANARAEILLELLTRSADAQEGSTALALSEVGYSKRNIALVLDDLALAGIVDARKEGNRVRFHLANRPVLERFLQPVPSRSGRWHLRLPVIAQFVELSTHLRGRDVVVQGIEGKKALTHSMPKILASGARAPAPTAIAETYWATLQQWLVDNLILGEQSSQPQDRVKGMIEGVWVQPEREIQRPERFTSAVLPLKSSDPSNDAQLQCLDLVQVPTLEPPQSWAWAVLSTAATGTYAHTIGLENGEPWTFATWAFGARRVYAASLHQPLAYGRITSAYGPSAADRARPDRPAIRLRLTRIDGDS